LKELVSLAGIDWRFAGRAIAFQSLGRFVFLCLMAFAFLAVHLSGGIGRFLSSQYAVTAILRGAASPEEAVGLARKIAALPPVRSAEYRDSSAAWEEFLRRWETGDADTEPARREARTAVQRLRDQPATRRP